MVNPREELCVSVIFLSDKGNDGKLFVLSVEFNDISKTSSPLTQENASLDTRVPVFHMASLAETASECEFLR